MEPAKSLKNSKSRPYVSKRELIGTHERVIECVRPDPTNQMGDHRLSLSCAVIERLDHRCGDDLVSILVIYEFYFLSTPVGH